MKTDATLSADALRHLDRLRQGVDAMGDLLREVLPFLRALAKHNATRATQAKFDPEDFAQEAAARVVSCVRSFQGTTLPELRRWLSTLLLNVIHDARRHLAAQCRQSDREVSGDGEAFASLREEVAGPVSAPPDELMRGEKIAKVQAALGTLPPDYREVIALREKGLEFEEIGKLLGGRTPGAARKLWERSVAELGSRLENPSDSDFGGGGVGISKYST